MKSGKDVALQIRDNCIGRGPEAEGACVIQEKENSVSYRLGGRGQ